MGRRLLVQGESHYNFAEVNLSLIFGRALVSVLLRIVFAFSADASSSHIVSAFNKRFRLCRHR